MSAPAYLTDPPSTHIGRPRKYQDIQVFTETIEAYFAGRDAINKPYTMHGLARALDCSRQTILNYEHYNDADVYVDAIRRARERVAEWTEDRLYVDKQHPAGPIFSLKNNFGWTDTQVVQHQGAVMMGVMVAEEARRALVPQVEIAQIPSDNATPPALGTDTAIDATFASEASLSPLSRNT